MSYFLRNILIYSPSAFVIKLDEEDYKVKKRVHIMDFQGLKQFMDHLTGWRIPGNSVSVCLEGKEVFSYQSGYADVEMKIPMTKEHYVNLYSCSKPATVTAALQLYEKGLIRLEDPLYAYIPEFKDMYIEDAQGIHKAEKLITLWNLFTMTAGFTYNTNTPAFDKARNLTGGKMDTLTVLRCLAKEPISFEPGATWQYSLCHDVLAGVVEVVSGQKFRDYMQEHIFEPLDMKATYNSDLVAVRMAQQYKFVDGGGEDLVQRQSGAIRRDEGGVTVTVGHQTNTLVFGPEYDSGGAGIVASVAEYSKFCAALANGGISASGERILEEKTIHLLRTPQLNADQQAKFNWPQVAGYSYGLGVRTRTQILPGTLGNIGEFGWGGAAGASIWIDPELKLSVCYAHHMLNPQEEYYQPRLRDAVYGCLK